jgi:enoyl-CoA hydratase/carnithine racemase
MLMTACEVYAPEALAWGMISEVHPATDLTAATTALAQRLCTHSAYSLREYKYAVRRTLPGFDLGAFVNETIDADLSGVMEEFARRFPSGPPNG